MLLTRERLQKLKEAGLDHVQISIQDVDTAAENADRIAGYKGGSEKKKLVAGWVRELGLPLTMAVSLTCVGAISTWIGAISFMPLPDLSLSACIPDKKEVAHFEELAQASYAAMSEGRQTVCLGLHGKP